MPEPKTAEAAAPAVMSRREAIVGALALAAGSLMAMRPEAAIAATGDPVSVGEIALGASATYVWRTATGLIGPGSPVLTQAAFNAEDFSTHAHRGIEGLAFAASGAAAAGVRGAAESSGQYGVLAENPAAGATALRVNGAASFSRSGRATISKGHSTRTVTVPSGLKSSAMILVTLQGSAGTGNHVRYAKRISSTSFKIYLTKASAYTVSCAWMIID